MADKKSAGMSKNMLAIGVIVVIVIVVVAAFLLVGRKGAEGTQGTGSSSLPSTTAPSSSSSTVPVTTSTTVTVPASPPNCANLNFTVSGPNQQVTRYCTWANATRLNITVIGGNYDSVLKFTNKTAGYATVNGQACAKSSTVGLYSAGVYTVSLTVQGQSQSTCSDNTTVVMKAA